MKHLPVANSPSRIVSPGAIGVGFALVVAPVAAIIQPDLLPGAILVLMLPLNAFVACQERVEKW